MLATCGVIVDLDGDRDDSRRVSIAFRRRERAGAGTLLFRETSSGPPLESSSRLTSAAPMEITVTATRDDGRWPRRRTARPRPHCRVTSAPGVMSVPAHSVVAAQKPVRVPTSSMLMISWVGACNSSG